MLRYDALAFLECLKVEEQILTRLPYTLLLAQARHGFTRKRHLHTRLFDNRFKRRRRKPRPFDVGIELFRSILLGRMDLAKRTRMRDQRIGLHDHAVIHRVRKQGVEARCGHLGVALAPERLFGDTESLRIILMEGKRTFLDAGIRRRDGLRRSIVARRCLQCHKAPLRDRFIQQGIRALGLDAYQMGDRIRCQRRIIDGHSADSRFGQIPFAQHFTQRTLAVGKHRAFARPRKQNPSAAGKQNRRIRAHDKAIPI